MAQSINTNEQTLARIKNNLQMPLIVRDLLLSNAKPSIDATYSLHEMIGNFTAEQALLCGVMTVQEIQPLRASSPPIYPICKWNVIV